MSSSDSDHSDYDKTNLVKLVEIRPQKASPRLPKQYLQRHESFMEWRAENKLTSFSEDVVLGYFRHISTSVKPSTMFARYSMLRATISANAPDVDISTYFKLRSFLKEKGVGFVAKRSTHFTHEQINTYLENAPDHQHLLNKIMLILVVHGDCQRLELQKLTIHDLADTGTTFIVNVNDAEKKSTRQFKVPETFYHLFRKYIALRPAKASCEEFLLNYKNGKCTKHVVGINKPGSAPKDVARFLKLPNPGNYNSNSIPRTASRLQGKGVFRERRWASPSNFIDQDKSRVNTGEAGYESCSEISNNSTNVSAANNNEQTSDNNPNKSMVNDQTNQVPLVEIRPQEAASRLPKQYLQRHEHFMEWREENKLTSFSEDVVLGYFKHISTTVKPLTMRPFYSMLCATISAIAPGVDMSRYWKLRSFLKQKVVGYVAKKSTPFTHEQINTYLENAPDKQHLLNKIVLILIVHGDCQRSEFQKLTIHDLTDTGTTFIVNVNNAENKGTRQIKVPERFYHLFRKYIALRPAYASSEKFLLYYQNGKCTKHVVGLNKPGSAPKDLARFLKLPNPGNYNINSIPRTATKVNRRGGHCLRSGEFRFKSSKFTSVAKSRVNTGETGYESCSEMSNSSTNVSATNNIEQTSGNNSNSSTIDNKHVNFNFNPKNVPKSVFNFTNCTVNLYINLGND